jgi:prophage regulatory protein
MTRLLDYNDLQKRGVKYSRSQIRRLELAGKFPKPVRLSQVRKAWIEEDIETYLNQRIAARDADAA